MQRPRFLLPILTVTTVLLCMATLYGVIGAVVVSFGLFILFHDTPQTPFPWLIFLPLLVLGAGVPLGVLGGQWLLYRKAFYRASLVVALGSMLLIVALIVMHVLMFFSR